jgi:hypothetical protein
MERSRLILATVLLIHATTSANATQPAAVRTAELSQPAGGPRLIDGVVTELSVIVMPSDVRLVGREVSLRDVLIDRVGSHGFWISTPGSHAQVFVIPAEGPLISPRAGDRVSVHGEIRLMGERLRGMLHLRSARHEQVYVRAFTVRPTGLWRRAVEKSEVRPAENRSTR